MYKKSLNNKKRNYDQCEKLIEHLTEKGLGVPWGNLLTPLSTLKLLAAKCFIIFCHTHKKYIYYNSIFFTPQFADIDQ